MSFKYWILIMMFYVYVYIFFCIYRLKMFLRLTPIRLRLYALVTLEVDVFIGTIKLTLYKTKLWQFSTPTIMMPLIDNFKPEEDKTPPQLESFGVSSVVICHDSFRC